MGLIKLTYICEAIPSFVVIEHRSDISFQDLLIFACILLQLLRILLDFILTEDSPLLVAVINVYLVSDWWQRDTCHRCGCFLRELNFKKKVE